LGKDRPGIVASVTKVLFRLGCNLEDSAMTRLGGEFAVMLLFTAPGQLSHTQLDQAFRPLAKHLHLSCHVKDLTKEERVSHARGKPYLLSVYGADRAGIVYRVSDLLARSGINITDLSTHRTTGGRRAKGGSAKPLYLMLLEVELPVRLAPGRLASQLQRLARSLGVEVSLRSADADVL